MFDVIMFIAKWIIDFIISLNKVMIPGTDMSLLRFFLSVLVLKTAFGFLFSFIQMEKRYREKNFRSRLNKKINSHIAKKSYNSYKKGYVKYNSNSRLGKGD